MKNTKKLYCVILFVVSIENLKNLKDHTLKKHYFFLLFAVSVKVKMKIIIFKEEEWVEKLKMLGLINNNVEFQET